MNFNSVPFGIFFTIFFFLYWLLFKNQLKFQNILLLLASYLFYAWVDWKFLPFLIGTSGFNYYLAIYIEKATTPKYKRLLLYIGILQGIGGLVFFKYFNFFISSFIDAFTFFGTQLNIHTISVILPLGISFYTFRTISYILDTAKGKIKPTKDIVAFFTYIAFFPTLLSGPIDRASTFIPQLVEKRVFDYQKASDALRQIIWGLFKKLVIANNCAVVTNSVFDNFDNLSSSGLLLGIFLYTIQIYADFSGYSDMAIGMARLIGFNINKNFDFPFFAQNIVEFWRKWHISLTSWLTDYVFTPLTIAFRRYNQLGLILAILVNFTIVGLWHGANWNYVLYGFLNGCFFIPYIINGRMKTKKNNSKVKLLPTINELINMIATFTIVMLSLVIFRSESILKAYDYYRRLFSLTLFSIPDIPSVNYKSMLITITFIIIMFTFEWVGRNHIHTLGNLVLRWHKATRWTFYYLIIMIIFLFGSFKQPFIYLQF